MLQKPSSKQAREMLVESAQSNKITLFIGPSNSGKTFLTNLIGKNKKSLIFDGKDFSNSSFYKIPKKKITLIIVDDLPISKLQNGEFNGTLTILLHQFQKQPEMIVTCTGNINQLPKDLEFNLNFNVFQIQDCNGIKPVDSQLEKLQRSTDKYKGQLVLNGFKIMRFIEVINGKDDYYYVFMDNMGNIHQSSVLCEFTPLKPISSKKLYQKLLDDWNHNTQEVKAI